MTVNNNSKLDDGVIAFTGNVAVPIKQKLINRDIVSKYSVVAFTYNTKANTRYHVEVTRLESYDDFQYRFFSEGMAVAEYVRQIKMLKEDAEAELPESMDNIADSLIRLPDVVEVQVSYQNGGVKVTK